MKKIAIILFIVMCLAAIAYAKPKFLDGFFGRTGSILTWISYQTSDGGGGWEYYQVSDGLGGWENYQVRQ